MTNLLVFFRADEDPELYEVLCDEICKHIKRFNVDQLLTMLANLRHTLSPAVLEVYSVVNDELGQRLHNDYSSQNVGNYIQEEDLIKISTLLLDHGHMKEELKHAIITNIESNLQLMSFEVLAELAVIFAAKQDATYCGLYFNKVRDKFLQNFNFLKDETVYKFLWAMFKADQFTAQPNDYKWQLIKDQLVTRAKETQPKYLTNILVLASRQKGGDQGDFFEKVEPVLIAKMREMVIEDLVNLFWSSLQIKKGTHYFYERLEEELTLRVKGIKDDQFGTLISCFAGDKYNNEFSNKFMKLIVSVLQDKRDRFAISTIVSVIWSLSKIDFNSDKLDTLNVIKEFANYPRLLDNMPLMPQKN